jgi:predicted ATPase
MSTDEKTLLEFFARLDPARRMALLEYAEFLAGRCEPVDFDVPEPAHEPRPDGESVIAAIRRLSRTYPMLDKGKMLHQTSALMTEHVMQGRDAIEVIEELELIFERQYQSLAGERDES